CVQSEVEPKGDEGRALERWNRRANDANAFLVGARDELTIASKDVLGTDDFGPGRKRVRGKQDVVDPEAHQDVLDAWLLEHVTFKPRQAGWAEQRPERTTRLSRAVVQQTIPDDAFVEDAQFGSRAGTLL